MDAFGIALIGLGFWGGYCAFNSFNPLTMIGAILRNPGNTGAIISSAKSEVAQTTSTGPTNSSTGAMPIKVKNQKGNTDEGLSLAKGNKAVYQNYAFQLLAQHGLDNAQQRAALVDLWTNESDWNPTASNPSGAYGIPQADPGSKLPEGRNTPWNQQIQWGINYIINRYGTPVNAWNHELATKGGPQGAWY